MLHHFDLQKLQFHRICGRQDHSITDPVLHISKITVRQKPRTFPQATQLGNTGTSPSPELLLSVLAGTLAAFRSWYMLPRELQDPSVLS